MRVDAFAKLTLSLRVKGVRADGFHELDAIIVSVTEPHDALSIEPAARISIDVTGPFAADVPADASNLAWRAAEACGAPVALELHKGIPAAAGLGGGSADAAAVLAVLGGDEHIARALGADVPFCLRGGAARVTGLGDEIELLAPPALAVVIATPRFGCATAAIYAAWDELGGPYSPPNDLEAAAHHIEPRLVAFKHAIEDAAGAPAVLAGSGSSYAVAFDDSAAAEQARTRITEAIDGWVWLGHTTDAGVVLNP
jgi:4-diphosphocytidyl-2-C-methyl-D-erythritol kinase